MDWQGYTSIFVTVLMVGAMARNIAGPDMVLMAGLTLFMLLGIVEPQEALAGFASPAVLAVAALFVVAAGVRDTGALDGIVRGVLGRPRSVPEAQARMMLPVGITSAFLNNTPVVAMMVPLVSEWSRRSGFAPSKLLMPLSFAAILGGTCTIFGTSTNMLVKGLLETHSLEASTLEALGQASLGRGSTTVGLFDIGLIGLPAALVGLLYIWGLSRWLLPGDRESDRRVHNPREYMVAMRVEADAPIAGKSIEEAGLRQLPGLYLAEIERRGVVMPAVGPQVRLLAEDLLFFTGLVDSVVDLRRIRGLVPETDQVHKLRGRPSRQLIEAVVAAQSPLVGRNARQLRFRARYNAAIIAVHRQGERIRSKVGDIRFEPGDTLLLESSPGFVNMHRNDSTFALVSAVEGSAPRKYERAPFAALVLLAMVGATAAGVVDLLPAALAAAGLLVAGRCVSADEARQSINLQVLIAIAASFGVGAALEQSGAAAFLAQGITSVAMPMGEIGLLVAIYAATSLLSLLISNNAAAALMFPIAMSAAARFQIEALPVALILMFAASSSFSTPIGYQTNLMVQGPGGYRFMDFIRFGAPLQVLVGIVAIAMTTWLWL